MQSNIYLWKNLNFVPHLHSREISWIEIEDFLKSDDGSKIIDVLLDISLTKMKKLVDKWHEKVNFINKKEEKEGDDFFTVITFEDDFSWVILNSKNSYDNEGLVMSHCAATYYKRKSPSSIIFSLRTPNNIAKITVEYDWYSNAIIQAQSRRNNVIPLKNRHYLVELLNRLQDKDSRIIQKMHEIHHILINHIQNPLLKYYKIERNGIFLNLENKFDYITPNCDISTKSFYYHPSMKIFGTINTDFFQINGDELRFLQNTKVNTQKLIITDYESNHIIPEKWIYTDIEKRTPIDFLDGGSLINYQAISRAFRTRSLTRTVFFGDYHILIESSRKASKSNLVLISNPENSPNNIITNSNKIQEMNKTVSGYNPLVESQIKTPNIDFNIKNNYKLENKEKDFSFIKKANYKK